MNILIILVFTVLFVCTLFFGVYFYKQKKYISSTIYFSLSFKLIIMLFMESGLKYYVALDGMKYEEDAWNLMKAVESNMQYLLDDFERQEYFNPFTQMSILIFKLFGKHSSIIILVNIIASLLCYVLSVELFENLWPVQKKKSIWLNKAKLSLLLVLAAYPTFNIWSCTVTKDPLATLFAILGLYYFFKSMQQKINFNSYTRLVFFTLAVSSFYISGLFRPYMLYLIFTGILAGLGLYVIQKIMPFVQSLLATIVLFFTGLYIFEKINNDLFLEVCVYIENLREGFLNAGNIDDLSKSAFLINYSFKTTWDYVLFFPQSVAQYFIGPYFWNIKSKAEAFGLLEALIIILLFKSFLRGAKKIIQFSRLEISVMFGIMVVFAFAQSLLIGNLGTIFRHRTFAFFIFFIISGAGLILEKEKTND